MKLIQKIGSRQESKSSIKTKQFGLFECPVCKEHVEKPLSHGRKNKTCGKKECKKVVFTNNRPDTSEYRKEPIISTLPYYSSISSYHNRIINSKYIELSDELKDLRKFIYITYAQYATVRELYPQVPVSIIAKDNAKLITKDNYEFVASQDELVTDDIFVGDFTYCCRKLIHELSVSYAVANQTIKKVTSDYVEKCLITKYGSKLKTLVVSAADYTKAYHIIVHNKSRSQSDTLYMMKSADHIKIGITNDVDKRISSIRTSTPFEVELIGSWKFCENSVYRIEQFIHKQYASENIKLEWFKLTDAQVEEIKNSLNSSTIVDDLAESERLLREEAVNTLVAKNQEMVKSRIDSYEESKRKAREANKKPVIETIHEYGDARFAHDRTNQIEAITTHGMVGTAIYTAWQTVKKIYGISKEWAQFEQFMKDIGAEYDTFAAEDIARVYPVDTANPAGPTNYVIKAKKDHIVKSAVARSVLQLKDGEIVAEYSSVTEAAKSVNGIATKISAVCKGNRKSHAGYEWKYLY